jgi:hypothetical protein
MVFSSKKLVLLVLFLFLVIFFGAFLYLFKTRIPAPSVDLPPNVVLLNETRYLKKINISSEEKIQEYFQLAKTQFGNDITTLQIVFKQTPPINGFSISSTGVANKVDFGYFSSKQDSVVKVEIFLEETSFKNLDLDGRNRLAEKLLIRSMLFSKFEISKENTLLREEDDIYNRLLDMYKVLLFDIEV